MFCRQFATNLLERNWPEDLNFLFTVPIRWSELECTSEILASEGDYLEKTHEIFVQTLPLLLPMPWFEHGRLFEI